MTAILLILAAAALAASIRHPHWFIRLLLAILAIGIWSLAGQSSPGLAFVAVTGLAAGGYLKHRADTARRGQADQ